MIVFCVQYIPSNKDIVSPSRRLTVVACTNEQGESKEHTVEFPSGDTYKTSQKDTVISNRTKMHFVLFILQLLKGRNEKEKR